MSKVANRSFLIRTVPQAHLPCGLILVSSEPRLGRLWPPRDQRPPAVMISSALLPQMNSDHSTTSQSRTVSARRAPGLGTSGAAQVARKQLTTRTDGSSGKPRERGRAS